MSYVPMMIPGTIMIMLGLAIRIFALNRLPKITFVIIWTLVCIRLIMPFAIPLFSIPVTMPSVHNHNASTAVGVQLHSHELAEWQFVVVDYPASASASFPGALTVIWIIGAAAVALYFVIGHCKFRRMVRDAIPVREDFVFDWQHKISRPVKIYSSDKISSPLTYGILWPVILLPSTMDWENEAKLQYILSHEYVHIRRFDCVLKLLFVATLCIHWFNPLVWVMFILANRDIELSCDEAILNEYGKKAKIDYAMTLLDMMESSEQHAACNFANLNKSAVEERFTILVASKNTSFVGSILAVVLIALPMLFVASSAYQSDVIYMAPFEQSVWVSESSIPGVTRVHTFHPEPPIIELPFVEPPFINEVWESSEFSVIIPNWPDSLTAEREVTITAIVPDN